MVAVPVVEVGGAVPVVVVASAVGTLEVVEIGAVEVDEAVLDATVVELEELGTDVVVVTDGVLVELSGCPGKVVVVVAAVVVVCGWVPVVPVVVVVVVLPVTAVVVVVEVPSVLLVGEPAQAVGLPPAQKGTSKAAQTNIATRTLVLAVRATTFRAPVRDGQLTRYTPVE